MLEQALSLETISIPSPTFQRKFKAALIRRLLGDEVTPEELAEIEAELKSSSPPSSS